MANPFALLKTGAFWVAKTAGKELISQAETSATKPLVATTHTQILRLSKVFINSPNPYDDIIAIFLCAIFGLEVPEKSE